MIQPYQHRYTPKQINQVVAPRSTHVQTHAISQHTHTHTHTYTRTHTHTSPSGPAGRCKRALFVLPDNTGQEAPITATPTSTHTPSTCVDTSHGAHTPQQDGKPQAQEGPHRWTVHAAVEEPAIRACTQTHSISWNALAPHSDALHQPSPVAIEPQTPPFHSRTSGQICRDPFDTIPPSKHRMSSPAHSITSGRIGRDPFDTILPSKHRMSSPTHSSTSGRIGRDPFDTIPPSKHRMSSPAHSSPLPSQTFRSASKDATALLHPTTPQSASKTAPLAAFQKLLTFNSCPTTTIQPPPSPSSAHHAKAPNHPLQSPPSLIHPFPASQRPLSLDQPPPQQAALTHAPWRPAAHSLQHQNTYVKKPRSFRMPRSGSNPALMLQQIAAAQSIPCSPSLSPHSSCSLTPPSMAQQHRSRTMSNPTSPFLRPRHSTYAQQQQQQQHDTALGTLCPSHFWDPHASAPSAAHKGHICTTHTNSSSNSGAAHAVPPLAAAKDAALPSNDPSNKPFAVTPLAATETAEHPSPFSSISSSPTIKSFSSSPLFTLDISKSLTRRRLSTGGGSGNCCSAICGEGGRSGNCSAPTPSHDPWMALNVGEQAQLVRGRGRTSLLSV